MSTKLLHDRFIYKLTTPWAFSNLLHNEIKNNGTIDKIKYSTDQKCWYIEMLWNFEIYKEKDIH